MTGYVDRRIAITATFETLAKLLADATRVARQASELAARADSPNEAIGSTGGLARDLEDALSLYRAAIALHKRRAP